VTVTAARDDWDAHWGQYAATAEDNPAQAYRRRRTLALLREAGSPRRLLDVGSGQGDLLRSLDPEFPEAELVGLELSETGIAEGRRKVPRARFVRRNLLVDAPVPPDLERWATHAVCSEVLEHVDDPALLLRHAAAFMAPGCRLVVTVPGGPRSAYDRHIGHRPHFSRDRLRSVLASGGFDVDSVQAAGFPAFNLYKLVVIARGERLIAEVADDRPSRAAELAMRAFDGLFRVAALPATPWGWQLVAVATRR
jgi:SAM-dependent methyltransferase